MCSSYTGLYLLYRTAIHHAPSSSDHRLTPGAQMYFEKYNSDPALFSAIEIGLGNCLDLTFGILNVTSRHSNCIL